MQFNSVNFFAFLFLIASLFVVIRGGRPRQYLLIAVSYVFYGAWDARLVFLLAAYTLVGWVFGRAIFDARGHRLRTALLIVGVTICLSGLAFFKYANFLYSSAASALGFTPASAFNIVLPIGISFFTFEVISYFVDIYRRTIEPAATFRQFVMFMTFFPRLVSGPIIRPGMFLPQTEKPIVFNQDNLRVGAMLFLGGMVLKTVCADNLSPFVDAVYRNVGLYSGSTLALAALAYAAQIFCDFDGYSLMAIGLARGFGYRLPDNFNMPYLAQSISDFWRRWHISLSSWLRDYLFIPLGGSKNGRIRTVVSIMITMILGGLWHGASWNFAFWGALHGIALTTQHLWRCTGLKLSAMMGWFITIPLVIILWIPFRSPDFATSSQFLSRMFSLSDGVVWFHPQSIIILIGLGMWHVLMLYRPSVENEVIISSSWTDARSQLYIVTACVLIVMFAQESASPFIYFQF